MVGSVAEGISMSLSQSQDLQELFAPEGLPSPPSFSHLHVNDLGLTPSPGSQQRQQQRSADVTHASSRNEKRDKPNDGVADKIATKGSTQQAEDLSTDTNEPLYDPLFDSDFAFQDFESDFLSHKRAHNEAFSEDFSVEEPLGKRQNQDGLNLGDVLPEETPSLTPDSSHRPEYVETALNTPAGIERSHTPNSLFSSLDLLFPESRFPAPLDNTVLFDNLAIRPGHAVSQDSGPELAPTKCVELSTEIQSASDVTQQRFSLDAQDLLANTNREILQRADDVPQYVSPYPEYRGSLGYLPSAPSLHVKCVEVVDERMNYRMECIRSKNHQLTHERNKYKSFYDEFSTVDQATGKTKHQMLHHDNAMLRRNATRHQKRVDGYKEEIEHWKSKLHEVSTLYNNLLYDVAIQRRLPEVAPPPAKYRPRPTQHQPAAVTAVRPQLPSSLAPTQPAPNQQPAQHPFPRRDAQSPSGTTTAIATANQLALQPLHSCPAPVAGRSSQAVTIDLTTEDDPNTAPNHPPNPSPHSGANANSGAEVLQSFRQKNYSWLKEPNQVPNATYRTGSSLNNANADRAATGSSSGHTSTDDPQPSRPQHGNDGHDVEQDELAQMMEAELGRQT
ncbi:uncharacterized protein EURHEDRAFT_379974 [Aspergillus ruber CBS 135680]|uniref:Uncharacterized protein n=1 Tax=Aspergillus ruber (strain CBS 135680) TaxID=1388766 RepID=A0A017S799_ASPRC|nr:uncharacterized protein EURHEDRAFT_379974 [Aspergillus ruber CBS 135680]EYE92484.1 hypothetical protein EURHEDRAFT_379974 [Aspergillus ruber CBS 135680]